MAILIKICGLSTPESIEAAVQAGASHLGLVHFKPSPRHVSLDVAAELRARVPPAIKVVLLTVNQTPEETAAAIQKVRPDVIQFHGRETPEWTGLVRDKAQVEVWKALGLKDKGTLQRSRAYLGKVDRLLFDSPAQVLPGGNGTPFNWSILSHYKHQIKWGIAGGLNSENVAEAIRTTKSPMVDASSGVERSLGVKDVDLIKAFCEAAQQA